MSENNAKLLEPLQAQASSSSTSNVGASNAPFSQTLERRVDWLCEDLEVVRRRVHNTLGPEATTAEGKAVKGGGVVRLHSLANQLLGELSEEREWRENLEAELSSIESSLLQERAHREKALETLSVELKETMKSLVRRIDNGLLNGTQELNTRAAKTEAGLKSLIQRVEEGLVTGSKFLQETLGGADLLEVSSNSSKATSSASGLTGASSCLDPSTKEVAGPLLKVWGELQEENLRLRQKRVQLEARQLRSRLNSRSPTSTSHVPSQVQSHIGSPLAASSRNRSPVGGRAPHSSVLGTGFRFKPAPRKDDQGMSTESSPVSTQATMAFGLGLSDVSHQPTPSVASEIMRDIDAMSTASSSLPNTKGSDDGGPTRLKPVVQTVQPRFIADARLGQPGQPSQRRSSQVSPAPSPMPVGLQGNGMPQPLGRTALSGIQSPGGARVPLTRSAQPVLQASRASNLQGITPPAVSLATQGGSSIPASQRSSVRR